MMKLRVLDLFSGIGGFSLGLERTGGFETVTFCELRQRARAVLKRHWPQVRQHDDVTTYGFQQGEADVITAGFPCQDISFAGEGAGLAGARSGLYREVIRAVRVVRPKRAVLENVAALLSRGLGTVLGDLATIGYDTEWHCIPASAVGAPHRRDRIWIVANPRGEQHEGCSAPLSGTLAAELPRAFVANYGRGGLRPDDLPGENPGKAGSHQDERRRSRNRGEVMAHAECFGRPQMEQPIASGAARERPANQTDDTGEPRGWGWWATEPDVGRVADGVPARVDRLEELGNAVVPQIPEIIGRAILASIAEAA